jgi:glutamate-1-semialdehyde 2,1-aminomutase
VPGVTAGVSTDTLTAPYNDLIAVKNLIAQYKGEIAAIIIEPVAGNMGCILPQEGFLEGLRIICDEEGIVFIWDEVMTGFRLAPGGAQELLHTNADLITYGKVIGAGMPVGAFGGKREIMEQVAPVGKVYQAGTLSGNPIAMIAGYTLLKNLQSDHSIYKQLDEKGAYLKDGLHEVLKKFDVPFVINQLGSMISVHFSEQPVVDFASAAAANNTLFNKFFHAMLKRGIYLPPSAFESWFLNNALTYEDLDATIKAAEESMQEISPLSPGG